MIFVSLISMAVLSGCGSNETVGDKLINENPTAITPEIVEWTTESTNNNNEENIEEAEGNMDVSVGTLKHRHLKSLPVLLHRFMCWFVRW